MPHHCAVTLQADAKEGYIDTGTELPCIDPHIYISVAKVREMGEFVGMVPGEAFDQAQERLAQLERELEGKQTELDALNAELDAISVIESSDRFKARRKPGPKKKAAQAA
jgi:hypothetical protein